MQQVATAASKTASGPVRQAGSWLPARFCPRHGSVLAGGPVHFTCSTGVYGGHGVVEAEARFQPCAPVE